MKIKLLETSLNLRIERKKTIKDYRHFAEVGEIQKNKMFILLQMLKT